MSTVAEIFHSLLEGPVAERDHIAAGSSPPALLLPTLTAEELHVLQPGGGSLRGRSNHSALLSSIAPAVGSAVEAAVARSLLARGLIFSPTSVADSERHENRVQASIGPELQMILEVRRRPLSIAVIDTTRSVGSSEERGWSQVLYGMVTEVEGQPVRALMEERISPDLFHAFTVRGFPEAVANVVAAVDPHGKEFAEDPEVLLPEADGSWPEVQRAASEAVKVSRVEATFPGASGPCLVRSGILIGQDWRLLIVGTRRAETSSLSAVRVSAQGLHSHLWSVLAGDESQLDLFEQRSIR
jgi:hypothetical protein